MYIQITEEGWTHLEKTVGTDYINNSIKIPSYTKVINGETWYKFECWKCFELMPPNFGGESLFKTTVMFDDDTIQCHISWWDGLGGNPIARTLKQGELTTKYYGSQRISSSLTNEEIEKVYTSENIC